MTAPDVTAADTKPDVQIRRTAVWMIMAFTAVGTVLASGITLSALSKFIGNPYVILLSAVLFIIAIVFIILSIGKLVDILLPSKYGISEFLADRPNLTQEDLILFGTSGSPKGAYDKLEAKIDKLKNQGDTLTDNQISEIKSDITKLREMLNIWITWKQNDLLSNQFNDIKISLARYALVIGACAVGVAVLGTFDSAKLNELNQKDQERKDTDKKLTERETRLNEREAKLKEKELVIQAQVKTPIELVTLPIVGSWVPSTTYKSPTCKPEMKGQRVSVSSVASVPTSVIDPTLVTELKIIPLTGSCIGQLLTIRSKDGSVVAEQKSLELNRLK